MTRSRIAPYATTVAASLLLLVAVLELWRADPHVPLRYMHLDSAVYGLLAKSIVETGWVLYNPHLGAPFALDYHDYPFVDGFHFLVMRALSIVVTDWAALLNLYYVLSFPLVALASLYAMRRCGVSAATAVVASLLFTFLPYHLHPARGIQHLSLSCYFAIPLVTLLLLRIASGRAVLGHDRRGTAATLSIALLAASTGVYYAFFACFLLLVAAAVAWRRGHRRSAGSAVALIALVALVVAAQIAPTVLYQLDHGANPAVATRSPGESELFGLRIADLLLPVSGHRVPALARLREIYDRSIPFLNESRSASLGLVGSFGFLFLLVWPFGSRRARVRDSGDLDTLAILNLAAVLLGTVGGFGALFALLVSPQLRAWSRISIYIGYFSLLTVALLLDRARRQAGTGGGTAGGKIFLALLVLLLTGGVADQTSRGYVPSYGDEQRAFRDDADFVHAIEARLPAGAMVFQLPYVPFPENPPVHDMRDYDHLRAYLHSRSLRWSYGSIKGRGADAWQHDVARRPVPETLRALALAGFAGVYLNRHGYEDEGITLERALAESNVRPALANSGGNLVFFDLTGYADELRATMSPVAWREASEAALRQPLSFHWSGCAKAETGEHDRWRWCGANATLTIMNPGPAPRRVELEMFLATGRPEPAPLSVEGGDVSRSILADATNTYFSAGSVVPFPSLVLHFHCAAQPLVAANDPRELVFCVTNFRAGETGREGSGG